MCKIISYLPDQIKIRLKRFGNQPQAIRNVRFTSKRSKNASIVVKERPRRVPIDECLVQGNKLQTFPQARVEYVAQAIA